MSEQAKTILDIKNLDISFKTNAGIVHAIRGVNLDLCKGETVAIVGESGSGKSVTMKAVMGLLDSNATVNSGEILYTYTDENGVEQTVDLLKMSKKQLRQNYNGQRIAMVFQDPMTSLNPVFTIGNQLEEAILLHTERTKAEASARAKELLTLVGINEPEKRLGQYPHELSGGMRQRVMIAMALACEPDILIADEPTTALDVTIQAQILDLMQKLQKELGMAIIMITHDLGVIAGMCDEVIVMYAGKICEQGTAEEIFYNPKHKYTQGLLSSIPYGNKTSGRLNSIEGTPVDLLALPNGCAFAPRCKSCLKICLDSRPERLVINEDHMATCWINVLEGLKDGSVVLKEEGQGEIASEEATLEKEKADD